VAKVIALSGDVGWEITANDIRAELKDAKGADVEFHINSPGGFVSEGIEIFNLIRAYSGHTTSVIVGLAASMGSYIPLASDKIVAYDNAIFMIHNAWAFAIGDHNDMRIVADRIEGMSNILARAYAKKTGKTVDAVKALMDKDTFFFGEEMLTEGFIDEIIDAGDDADDNDKESAIIVARASMDACLNRMRKSEAANDDLQKAVAYVESLSLLTEPTQKSKPVAVAIDSNHIETPAVAGKKKQEDKFMTLAELFAANPGVKAEYDAAILQAHADGVKAAKDEMKALVAKVKPILASAEYGESVKAFGAEVLTGDKTLDGFEAIVFMEDQRIEKAKADAAADETDETEETPGADASADADAQASFDAKKERVKAGV
jgi:ATP-dependent Clp endopeptidase proteolytic subunit ClpP